jgi:hypothetical protein
MSPDLRSILTPKFDLGIKLAKSWSSIKMTKQLNTDQLDRLAEIKEEILVLLDEALDLVRGTPEEQRANHWFATFCTALDKDNTQGSDSTITMQETIDALKESADA